MLGQKWAEFESAGPEYAMPINRFSGVSSIPGCHGTLYAGLYPKSKFENLVHFQLYQFFSSSIQQVLLQTGAVDYEWFFPEDKIDGLNHFRK